MDHSVLTRRIISCAFDVSNCLGPGLLEKTYETALGVALRREGLGWSAQRRFDVVFDGVVVGTYVPDLIVEDTAIIEVKCQRLLQPRDEAQLVSYLRIARLDVGLLLNFHEPRVVVKRLFRVPTRIRE